MLRNEVFLFTADQLKEKAALNFANACGFDLTKPKHQRMMHQAEEMLQTGQATLRPAAVVSAYPGMVIQGDTAIMDGQPFSCTAFSRMDGSQIEKIFVYALTIGEVSCAEDGDVMAQLYADIWGTAYADAALEYLAELMKAEAEAGAGQALTMEPSFGPGFYGMPVTAIPDFFQLLDGAAIGISVRESGFMVPQKSCAGFLIAALSAEVLPPSDCLNCQGNKGGCQFCRNYKKSG